VTFLDSDILVDMLRGFIPSLAWYAGLVTKPSLPGVVAMELIQVTRNSGELRLVTKVLKPTQLVWPTEVDCLKALADFTRFHLSHSLGLVDALIAATVAGRAGTLCTFNVKHYRMVPGLATSQPYDRS